MRETQHMLVSHPAPQRCLNRLGLPVPEYPTGSWQRLIRAV